MITTGREEGQNRINQLNYKLVESGRIDDMMKAATDLEYQQQLLEEFAL